SRADALAFARKVIEAEDVVKEEYVRTVNQGTLTEWAIRELYNDVEEPLPASIETKLKGVKDMTVTSLRDLLVDARQHLGNREDLENLKDLTIAVQRMLGKLDPYSTYIDPETRKRFDDDIAGNFTGIGVQVSRDAQTDQLLVVTPIKGSPAYLAETPMSKAD